MKKDRYIDALHCPFCLGELEFFQDHFRCSICSQNYEIIDNIPRFFILNEPAGVQQKDVTEIIKSFYEKNPFPNYDDFDDAASLMNKARKGIFAKLLDDQVPFGSLVLEAGCGTGQLANFLSISSRTVIGTDICLNSLKLGETFKQKNQLKRVHFVQMNLFKPCFKPESFDLVICNGVLHHTGDPYRGFKSLASLVKPHGYILIGLYHKYGRLITDLRRFMFRITGNRFKTLDSHASDPSISHAKREAWFRDQYQNPHESKHTLTEVLQWLRKNDLVFVKCIPKAYLPGRFTEYERLFEKDRIGSWAERVIVNARMILTGAREGGFFIVIAQKVIENK
jgi:SAM-dependent methyltransferase